jgi:polyhydroxyalkanoate synthesis regulator phasin
VAAIDVVRKYLDIGLEWTQDTREKAEEAVRELVKTGEVRAEDAQSAVRDLVDRSRKRSEELSERIRTEVKEQLSKVQPASAADLQALVKRIDKLEKDAKKPATTRKPAARKPAAKKTTASRSTAKKPAARK